MYGAQRMCAARTVLVVYLTFYMNEFFTFFGIFMGTCLIVPDYRSTVSREIVKISHIYICELMYAPISLLTVVCFW